MKYTLKWTFVSAKIGNLTKESPVAKQYYSLLGPIICHSICNCLPHIYQYFKALLPLSGWFRIISFL